MPIDLVKVPLVPFTRRKNLSGIGELYLCRRVIYWIYTMMVIHHIVYAAVVWAPTAQIKNCKKELSKQNATHFKICSAKEKIQDSPINDL